MQHTLHQEEFHKETVRKLEKLYQYDCLRANKSLELNIKTADISGISVQNDQGEARNIVMRGFGTHASFSGKI